MIFFLSYFQNIIQKKKQKSIDNHTRLNIKREKNVARLRKSGYQNCI